MQRLSEKSIPVKAKRWLGLILVILLSASIGQGTSARAESQVNSCDLISHSNNVSNDDVQLMPGCEITGCCNSDCSQLRVCCMHWTCTGGWYFCWNLVTGPGFCCREWGPGYFCDCYPAWALPSQQPDNS